MTTLREFKAKYMTKLMNLKRELLSKYHDKVDRVNYITDLLMREFEEFEVLMMYRE